MKFDLNELTEQQKRNLKLGAVLIAVLLLAVIAVLLIKKAGSADDTDEIIAEISSLTPEELEEMHRQEALDELLKEYDNFGIIQTKGYINLRSRPDEIDMTDIIGKLEDGVGLDIIEEDGDWSLVSSGGIKGYCKTQFITTGEEAERLAEQYSAERVVITTDVLNIRTAPEKDPSNIIAKARQGERYVLVGTEGDWAKVQAQTEDGTQTEGYVNISDGNAEIRTCLNAAKRLDLRTMATTQYDNLVLASTEGYINIRKEPKDDGINNIIGKFALGNGAELLDTVTGEDGNTWYKIKSGKVTGYVRADYCKTGDEAKKSALDYAKLTAYVNVDSLNVRSEPSLDARAWTNVTKNQAYDVINQLDGWVQIELDAGDGEEDSDKAYISTRDNNVEVRYGLGEAIEYYPAVEAANAAAAFRNNIVNFACKYVGNRYVWGGTSLTNGTDCSGFTMRVMEKFGISLPRTSREQAKVGSRVTSDNMKPGDLVFYANSSGTINHVAIYIGNGQVISAASRKSGIRISRWNYRTPVAIRNVIGA